jgi:hypothetical protein
MKLARLFALSAVFVALCGINGMAQGYPQGPPPGERYGQGGGWDTPPGEFRDAQRQGFRDGIEGARKDVDNRRRPNVNNRDEYRHPNVPRSLRDDYRFGFKRGYQTAMQHMAGGGPGRPY